MTDELAILLFEDVYIVPKPVRRAKIVKIKPAKSAKPAKVAKPEPVKPKVAKPSAKSISERKRAAKKHETLLKKSRRTPLDLYDDFSNYFETDDDLLAIRRTFEESGGADWFSVKGATAYEY